MKLLTILILSLLSFEVFAPGNNFVPVLTPEPSNPYLPILNACYAIESSNGVMLLNAKEDAAGPLGIRPIKIADYNRRTGKRITLNDRYNYEISKTIFLYYVSQCDYRDIKGMAIAWNGKSKENKYYSKIMKIL